MDFLKNMDNQLKKFYKATDSINSQLSNNDKQRIKENIFNNLGTQEITEVPVSFWTKTRNAVLNNYALIPLAVILFITSTTYASANSLPGDNLYPIKRQIEQVRLLITPTKEAKLNLEVNFAEKRLQELEQIKANEKTSEVKSKDEKTTSDDKTPETKKAQEKGPNKKPSKATENATHAREFLEKTRNDLEKQGHKDKAKEIDDHLKSFRTNSSEIIKIKHGEGNHN
jgi:hypothetical protein